MPSIEISQSEVLERISNNVDMIRTLLEEIQTLANKSGVNVNIADLWDQLAHATAAGGWDSSNEGLHNDARWNSSIC